MQSDRIEILDSLRAFAAISVCLFHFVCTTTGYIESSEVLRAFSVGQYGVQCFFVISGFVIPWSMYRGGYKLQNFFSFFLKRLSRLEPPYVCSVLLALTILWLRHRLMAGAPFNVSGKQVALHFFYLIPFFEGYDWLNRVYWTLAVEFQYYLCMALVFVPLLNSPILGAVVFSVLACACRFVSGPDFFPYWLPVFMLGIVLFLYFCNKLPKGYYLALMAGLVVFSVMYYPLAAVCYALVPVACIHWIKDIRVPVLHFLGNCSYSIYLTHTLVGASVINVLSHRYVEPFQKFLVICIGLFVTLVASLIMYHFVERPSKKLSASIAYAKK